MSRDRVRLSALLVTAGVQNIAYTVMIPFVPLLQSRFAMTPLSIGAAFAGFTATKALVQPAAGWVADRWGARLIGLTGLALATVATGLLAVASSGDQVLALRLLWGLGEGLAMPALYRVAAALGEEAGVPAGKVMGWFGSAAVLGMSAGPGLIALFSSALTFHRAFLLGSVFTLVGAVLFALIARPGRPAAPPPPRHSLGRRSFTRLLWPVFALGLLDLVNNFVYAAIEPVLPMYAQHRLGADEHVISVLFFAGLLLFAGASLLGGALTGRMPPLRLCALAFGAQVVALAVATVSHLGALAIGFLVLMVAQPCVYVALRTALAGLSQAQRGTAFGWFGLVSDLGWVLGPLVMTGLLDRLDNLVFAVLAVLTAAAAAAAWRLDRTIRPVNAEQDPIPPRVETSADRRQ